MSILLAGVLFWAQSQPGSADARPHLQRAEQATQRNDFEAALREIEEAIRLSPSDAEAHGRLGILQRRLGRPADAVKSLERATQLQPNSRLKVLLAFAYMDAGAHEKAIPLLASNFEAEQSDAVKLAIGQRLVESYLAAGAADLALPPIQKLRQMAPHDPNVLYLSSKVYMSLWNGAFRLMMEKAPGSYQVRLIQAEALESQGRFGDAAIEYREILKIAPKLEGTAYRLGRALLRSGSGDSAIEQAVAAFHQELEINPHHVATLTELGEIHLGKGQGEEASRYFQRAIQVQPADVAARVGMAKAQMAQQHWAKALEHLEAAASAAPADEAVQYNLMLVYRGLGRTAEARQAMEKLERLQSRKKAAQPTVGRPE